MATPGRVLDLTERGVANMTNCGILVMDEVLLLHKESSYVFVSHGGFSM